MGLLQHLRVLAKSDSAHLVRVRVRVRLPSPNP